MKAADLDLTEAIEAARRTKAAVAGRLFDIPGDAVDIAISDFIEAAAPIIARQVAEKIAERIEAHRGTSCGETCEVCFGLTCAARIAREVGSDV